MLTGTGTVCKGEMFLHRVALLFLGAVIFGINGFRGSETYSKYGICCLCNVACMIDESYLTILITWSLWESALQFTYSICLSVLFVILQYHD